MMSQLSKTVSDVIISFPERFEDFHEKMSFFTHKIMQKIGQNFFIGHFLKNVALWCSSDYGDQKVPIGPPKPQIFSILPNTLHTCTMTFFRYWHFSKPYFFDVLVKRSTKGQQVLTKNFFIKKFEFRAF